MFFQNSNSPDYSVRVGTRTFSISQVFRFFIVLFFYLAVDSNHIFKYFKVFDVSIRFILIPVQQYVIIIYNHLDISILNIEIIIRNRIV